MAKRKGKPYPIGTFLTTLNKDSIEITSCYEGWWGGEPGYHVKLNGKQMRDSVGSTAYITDRTLAAMIIR